MTKFLNISTDNTLGGASPSDETVSSQKAIKEYVDSQTGTAPAFANITGQPTDNANLATALNAKQNTLTSGTNIKTINSTSLLGSGNFAFDSSFSTTSTNAVQNKVIISALNGKLDGFTLRFAGNWSGGVHAVNFVTIDYSECNSENGVFIKFSMVNSHGNGQAGRFLQDVVLNVKYTGEVAGTLYRYFAVPIDQSASEYYGSHYYGDVFWVNDTTNKIVKFYVLMHQFSYTSQSPYFRLNASTKGDISQSTDGAGAEEYSSGTRVWTTINWLETDQTYSSTSDKPQSGVAVASAISGKANSADLATVATSGSYNDLSNKPTIPTVNDATLTIQKNGTSVATFTANSSTNQTANITVPTDTGDLTNGAGYITGITSSDVTSALGYTPYNSSNPAGYTSNVGTVTSVNNVQPVNGNVTLSIPSEVTESIVSGWGFTKNTGTVTSVNNISPVGGNVTIGIPTVDQSYDGTSTNAQSGVAVKSAIDSAISSVYKPAGSVAFASLPALSSSIEGYVYNVTDSFTTTSDFVEGSGKTYPAGTNVVCIDVGSSVYKWDVLSGMVDLSGYVPTSRKINNKALTSDISLTASDVGALPDSTVIPTVNNPTITITQGGVTKGSFTLNQSSGDTIALDAGGSVKTFDLFDHKWSDYQLNDQSWLRADTFSWQDGTVYSDAYNHLEDDYSNGTSTTETVGSYTITYVLAADGHKITTDETNVANIYNESGVAWYYVLDTVNQRFKLPRTKYGFTGLRDTVGKYVKAGLPNITGDFATGVATSDTGVQNGIIRNAHGAFSLTSETYTRRYASQQSTTTALHHVGVDFNASSYNSIYGNSTTVQPPATQMYLYFYVGQFSQSATEQTAGLNSELFNGKADLDLGNLQDGGIRKTVRTGMMIPFGGSTAPSGWLLCDGSAVSRTTYADLFDVIGTTYGTGNGSTTFNLPNINNIVKNVDTTVSIKGTGKTLGLTNGSKTFGVRNGGDAGLYGYTGLYNVDVGTSPSGSQVTTSNGVGVTTDASKSGLTGTLSRTNFSCKFIIKF